MVNWHEALKFTVKEFEGAKSEWGAVDCCQFVNAYWFNLTGEDHASAFEYDSRREAVRILAENDGMAGLLKSLLGESREDAEPGDLVLLDYGDLQAPGIYTGYCVFTIDPSKGLVRVPPEHIEEAWCPQV